MSSRHGSRRQARELALQILYSMDMLENHDDAQMDRLFDFLSAPTVIRPFCRGLVDGVLARKIEIDRIVLKYSSNWKIHRMSIVDRNIIRLCVYEMMEIPDIPAKVSINEAIEVSKRFGTEESTSFINGILDSIFQNYIMKTGKQV